MPDQSIEQPSDQPAARQWFPGIETGPRVAIPLSSTDVDTMRGMLEATPIGRMQVAAAAKVLRDLDVRAGALAELVTDPDPELTDMDGSRTIRGIPLLPDEHDTLRAAYDAYLHMATPARNIINMFADFDRRIGAAQARLAVGGDLEDADIRREPGTWTPPPGGRQPHGGFGRNRRTAF